MVIKNYLLCIVLVLISCKSKNDPVNDAAVPPATIKQDSVHPVAMADAAAILSRKQVPILCYHHIKTSKPGDYVVPPVFFAEQMQALADSGYETILPDELYNYLATGASIPAKSVMITFDDTDLEQFTIGAGEMKKHNFKGVFFIMTVSIGRPGYMSKEQIKQLANDGHSIEAHTWDHHRVTEYTAADWQKQLDEAKQNLEKISNKPVEYFAYPFGLWNKAAIPPLQERGIKMAFQLSGKYDLLEPIYTVRRMLVPGTWTTPGLFKAMKRTFNN